jgi:hypothetical protein
MKIITFAAVTALLLATTNFGLAQVSPAAPPDRRAGVLSLVKVSPEPGAQVTRDTVVVARLAFDISMLERGNYVLIGQVDSKIGGRTTDGKFPSDAYIVLEQPSGEATFSFPLAYVWDEPDVKHPIAIRYILVKRSGSRRSMSVGSVDPVQYQDP